MMTSHACLLAGLAVGLSVAVPLGPMGLLCIQRTLAAGMRIGVSTGLGAATVNVAYGALILVGLNTVAPLLASGGRVLSFLGGVFLLWSAARTFGRRALAPAAGGGSRPALSAWAAYGSAVAFNMANPMGPVLIMALLSPVAGVAGASLWGPAALLLGMFAAASAWWVCLSFGVALLRSRLNLRALHWLNQVAGVALTLYGALALARSAGLAGG